MLGTVLVGGADDTSILVEIFSMTVSIFEQVFFLQLKERTGSSHPPLE
jgi:hypothetical protein